MSETKSDPVQMTFRSPAAIELILIEADVIPPNATRQVRRAAVTRARKVLGDRLWTVDRAKRALGWLPENERVRRAARGRSAMAAIASMSAMMMVGASR